MQCESFLNQTRGLKSLHNTRITQSSWLAQQINHLSYLDPCLLNSSGQSFLSSYILPSSPGPCILINKIIPVSHPVSLIREQWARAYLYYFFSHINLKQILEIWWIVYGIPMFVYMRCFVVNVILFSRRSYLASGHRNCQQGRQTIFSLAGGSQRDSTVVLVSLSLCVCV